MKVSMFHLMPHRELPDDFERRYKSVWVDPPFPELADPDRIGQFYNWTLDELVHAARVGFDGICVNEHHQNAYGFMPGPNLMGSALARETNGMDVAIVQMGATLPTTQPPIRIAEEYAMLDCISGGRLIAGMPLGTAMDACQVYGITPVEQRERYYEAHDLILKAWQSQEMFAWNGKYTKLGKVNLWPRPVQKPHPPVWVPGTGSYSTWEFSAKNDHCYCFLSYFGAKAAEQTMAGFWRFVDQFGLKQNPYRAGFLQLVVVADSDAQAERDYARHCEYFYRKCMHIPLHYFGPPGHQDYRSLEKGIRSGLTLKIGQELEAAQQYSYRELVDKQFVIAGSPATVREQLIEACRNLHIGNLMVLLQIGSMPHDLTMRNIDLFAEQVLPHLRPLWDDEPWENEWWPERLRNKEKEQLS
ncbi:LLM class flavin-dependent oxidoreductase [Pseudonocardia asaccharolytica]|uniref:Monooxygenase n=1 Tax=Pseudonocardia asaccharolytica DSM 44247 = NBRC 16224 TaxID=1123024 RepID=A0A511D0R5_9PSEU|nr:LLM class flavin-dependent oxidoreductase [Pseudonocardia asaccharolytica]GEL18381.1 monooxygenase [Pseudonocardia asaccharolytica DSM 44247 = NBRC 16224]